MQRMLLAAAVLVLSAVPAMAQITQPVSFSVFNRANRQPGTYISASAEIPLGVYALGITDTMTDADASDPSNSFTVWTEISQDGTTWVQWGFREQWQGGTHFDKTTQAMVPNHIRRAWSNTDLANGTYVGWRIRAVIDQPVQMRVGFNVVAYPPDFNPQVP